MKCTSLGLILCVNLGVSGVLACSADESTQGSVIERGSSGSSTLNSNAVGTTTQTSSGGSGSGIGNTGLIIGGTGDGTGGTGVEACATQTTMTELLPVYLVFGFDRSGSMGKGDEDWHDQSLKWDPVSAATKAFFADPASQGLSAALKFFPHASGEDERCDTTNYEVPDVPMTALPSSVFATALDVVPTEDWIGGTPTLEAMQGMLAYIDAQSVSAPGRYAIVLVTDGYPQDCPDSSIDSVATLAESVALTIPTYVIGVANPPIDGAPDTVSNLSQIAAAGGTEQAYLIDTGNPEQTAADFAGAIEAIRSAAISCDVAIPEPPADRSFDKEAVSVNYSLSSGGNTQLSYDPACSGQTWHYDDPTTPTRIELCPEACATVQSDSAATLSVDFACEPQFDIPE